MEFAGKVSRSYRCSLSLYSGQSVDEGQVTDILKSLLEVSVIPRRV